MGFLTIFVWLVIINVRVSEVQKELNNRSPLVLRFLELETRVLELEKRQVSLEKNQEQLLEKLNNDKTTNE